jgi:hypothetical protein
MAMDALAQAGCVPILLSFHSLQMRVSDPLFVFLAQPACTLINNCLEVVHINWRINNTKRRVEGSGLPDSSMPKQPKAANLNRKVVFC